MSWENSIFNDEGGYQTGRDSDTHMELGREDLCSPREQTEWEKDLIEYELAEFGELKTKNN